ncbi:GMC oxidoreductase [Paralimibaculum aggregatum]|nr:GMC family oxidoreductase [Limibaculum sp. NKW23]
MIRGSYDLVVVGSGFGSLFYLRECLGHLPRTARVALLERGAYLPHARQLALRSNSADPEDPDRPTSADRYYRRLEGEKPWNFTIGLGGGTLCWWGQAPRLHPSDFGMRRLYGRGEDWPISYDDLEPHYCAAEEIIGIAGDSDRVGPFRRSRPYPLPAFRGSGIDMALRERDPMQLALPAARDSIGALRAQCCAHGECRLCPQDAKFTALNGLPAVLEDARISILTGANVLALELEAGHARRVVFERRGRRQTVSGDHVVLGANAICNPAILQRSGLGHPELGRGIAEQMGANVEVQLAAHSGVDGGTAATGQNIRLLDGAHRRAHAAAAYYFDNRWKHHGLRLERGRHLNTLNLMVIAEALRSERNFVEVPEDWDALPVIHHATHGAYAEDGLRAALRAVPEIFAGLGLERVSEPVARPSEAHVQCTTPAGTDPGRSIVDGDLLHHRVRNLSVVGTSVFPTAPAGNPSLTAAAWSLRAARRLFGAG